VIKTVTNEDVGFEELGGAMAHNSRSGVAHMAAENEDEVFEQLRALLSFLPLNNLDEPPYAPPADDPERMEDALQAIIPDNPSGVFPKFLARTGPSGWYSHACRSRADQSFSRQ